MLWPKKGKTCVKVSFCIACCFSDGDGNPQARHEGNSHSSLFSCSLECLQNYWPYEAALYQVIVSDYLAYPGGQQLSRVRGRGLPHPGWRCLNWDLLHTKHMFYHWATAISLRTNRFTVQKLYFGVTGLNPIQLSVADAAMPMRVHCILWWWCSHGGNLKVKGKFVLLSWDCIVAALLLGS